MNSFKTCFIQFLYFILILLWLNISALPLNAEAYNVNGKVISQVNTYVLSYEGQSIRQLIDNNVQDFTNCKLKQELYLSMMYDTDLFYDLFTEEDYENSIKKIIELEKASYKVPKMLLYKALYLKSKGEWDIALQVLDKSIELLDTDDCKMSDKTFYLARAKFEKGIMSPDQSLIVEAVDLLLPVVKENPDNVIYLSLILNAFRFVEIPQSLYEKYKEDIISLDSRYEKINKELNIQYYKNLLCLKDKLEQKYFDEVMKPLTEEILSRWKTPSAGLRSPVHLLYYFQISRDRKIINIKLIAQENASEQLQLSTYESIENAIIPHLLEGYKFDKMNVLFIFASE
ncbi:MAG: hypothetical protein AB7V50_06020 [Vampirovibrionia bacterium]